MSQACDVYCYGNGKLNMAMVELGIGANEVQKIMVFGDWIVHCNCFSQFLLRSTVGGYLDIDPHMYIMHEQFSRMKIPVGFVKIINKSEMALTFNRLRASHDLLDKFIDTQPEVVCINIGLSDMKMENISWCNADLSKTLSQKVTGHIGDFSQKD